jgi:UDP-N-acetylbacillosamine transaminase
MISRMVKFVRDLYQTEEFIPLHVPQFGDEEKRNVSDTIDSTFVSSVGAYVDQFEGLVQAYTGAASAISATNGTAALHASLYLSGVRPGDLVITQALTFVATCNALYHMGAEPVFVDVSTASLGLCPKALDTFLTEFAAFNDEGECVHVGTNKKIKAVIPMHTFGHPVELDELLAVCNKWNLALVEDAAESLGSFYKGRHTGTIGRFSALSFNGNKIITTGGGGMLLCADAEDGRRAKHLTTTAKVPHPYEYFHDEAGFNYRMPNLNAALGCAQMERLGAYVKSKRDIAKKYEDFFAGSEYQFVKEPEYAKSNYWLNAVQCPDKLSRDNLLKEANAQGVMTRPIWTLMHRLPMFERCLRGDLTNSEALESTIVNLPSSPIVRR